MWHAYAISGNMGIVAKVLIEEGASHLRRVTPTAGSQIIREHIPVLSPKATWEKLGACVVEPKFDGYYCQIHKKRDEIFLFSVRGENWAEKYPSRFLDILDLLRYQIELQEAILEAGL